MLLLGFGGILIRLRAFIIEAILEQQWGLDC